MSRNSLHRPRRPRVVWDRPATGTRLLPSPFPPTVPLHIPQYKRCPRGPSPPPPQRSITVPPGLRDRLWKVPGHCPACPFQRQLPDRRPSHRAQWIRPRRIQGAQISRAQAKGHHALARLHRRPSRKTPFTRRRQSVTAPTTPPSGRAQFPLTGLQRRSLRRGYATQRRHRSHAPISPYGRALLVVETAPHRDPLASLPRPLRSTGPVAEPASMWNIRCGGQHPSVQPSPSSCARVRDLPSPPTTQPPQSREKRTFPAKQSNLTPGSAHQSKLPHSYPPKGAAQQPIPQPLPPQLNNRRP